MKQIEENLDLLSFKNNDNDSGKRTDLKIKQNDKISDEPEENALNGKVSKHI